MQGENLYIYFDNVCFSPILVYLFYSIKIDM